MAHRAAMRSRRLLWALLSGSLALVACKGKPQPAASEGTAAAADPQACALYREKICAHAGESAAICDAVKKSTELFGPATCGAALAEVDGALRKIDEMGQTCRDLADKLCAELGASTQTCQMVRSQTPTMPPEQCEQMMGRYADVLAELQRMEAKNRPLPADQAAKLVDGSPPSFGPDDAAVTIVEFSDFQCPYCSMAAATVPQIRDKYADRARFVFRQFPLGMHPDAHLAAQAALAAHEQGKFWAFHDLLFENQRALDRASLDRYAAKAGLDVGRFKRALDDGKFKATVDGELALGQQAFVDGTPTMFVNGVRVANATDFAAISQAIDAALAAAG
jgi:protein-disulfide isomerase